jgi:pyridinium-3,5-bisthiocarboxylic acid mononucleotide nickel chelatase
VRVGYLDCSGGISGDMFVGALLSAGWEESKLRECVAWLNEEIVELVVESRSHNGLAGLGIRVVSVYDHSHDHSHDHGHDAHRGLAEVLECLDRGNLNRSVRESAEAVFRRLAEAEAFAHGKSAESVHFHEVGAVDAMIDIVAVCQGLHDLGIETLYVSPLPVGKGTVKCAHGEIPLPSPATSYLLQGGEMRFAGEGERTTPTGAALATTLGVWGPPPAMALERLGVGAGERGLPDVPNLVRLFVGEERTGPNWGHEDSPSRSNCPGSWGRVVLLESQIDDATAEEMGEWADRLYEDGALEVFYTPVNMKKGRPGSAVTVICAEQDEERLMSRLLTDTSTIGVRRQCQWRRELERRERKVQTRYGEISVKEVRRGTGWIGKPEFEDCRAEANRNGVPVREVWRAAIAALAAESTR